MQQTQVRSFDALLAPLGESTFFEEFLGKQPIHLKGDPQRFSYLLTNEALNRVIRLQQGNRLRLFRDGNEIPKIKFTKKQHSWVAPGLATLDIPALNTELGSGATIVINNLEQMSDEVASLARIIGRRLRNYVDVVAFAAWHPTTAFKTHWDHEEAFILQIRGKKRWRLFPHVRAHPSEHDFNTDYPAPTGDPFWEGDVEAGDLLYIPSGWWHDASSIYGETLHISFGCELPTGLTIANELITRLREDELARAAVPLHSSASLREYFSALRDRLNNTIETFDVGYFFDERDCMAPSLATPSLPWSSLPVTTDPWEPPRDLKPATLQLDDRTWLHWLPTRPVTLVRQDSQVTLDALGYRFAFDVSAEPVLEQLSQSGPVRWDQFRLSHPQPYIEDLVHRLISWGLVATTSSEYL